MQYLDSNEVHVGDAIGSFSGVIVSGSSCDENNDED